MDSVGTVIHWIASVSTTQAMLVVRLLCFKLDKRANNEAHGTFSLDNYEWRLM